MALTDTAVRNAKPTDKPRKLADEKGLFLQIHPNGSKYWRFKYRFGGKEKLLALGVYPDIGLKEAREKRDKARTLLANETDPGAAKQQAKQARKEAAANSFEAMAQLWLETIAPNIKQKSLEKHQKFLDQDVYPSIGSRPVSEITAPDLLAIIKRIDSRGANDIARRVHSMCGRIFRYAVGHGMCQRDPSRDIELADILGEARTKHHASITNPKEAGALLRAIDGFTGAFTTRCAMRLAPFVFVRPGELRHAEWSEFDLDKGEWRIPASKMKMKEQHIVPLSKQAVAILREIQPLTGAGRFVFPGERTTSRPMSENTINGALRRLGYTKDEMTGHGFRSMASTLLHELGYPHAVIERQLAHGERNKVAAAYNYAEYLPDRRKMMQEWADYLDKLKQGADVVPLFKQG